MLNLVGHSATTPQRGDGPLQHTVATKVEPFVHPVYPGPLHLGKEAEHQSFKAVLTFQTALSSLPVTY